MDSASSQRRLRISAYAICAFIVLSIVGLKIYVHMLGQRYSELYETIQDNMDFTQPVALSSSTLILCGMSVSLAWDHFAEFGTDENRRTLIAIVSRGNHQSLALMKLNESPIEFEVNGQQMTGVYGAHELLGSTTPNQVTVFSNPLSDVKTLRILKVKQRQFPYHNVSRVENSFMKGHYSRADDGRRKYELVMKGGGSDEIEIWAFANLREPLDSLLRTIQLVSVPDGFSQKAFEALRAEEKAGHWRMAFLRGLEAITNEEPREDHLVALLDLCHKTHDASGKSLLLITGHFFPSEKETLEKKYPEFTIQKNEQKTIDGHVFVNVAP